MPHITFFLCSGIVLLNTTTITAQITSAYRSFSHATEYQFSQQKQWQNKQLPINSVLYKYNTTPMRSIGYNFSVNKPQRPFLIYPPATLISYPGTNVINTNSGYLPASLQSYLHNSQVQINYQQRQAWWKDPSKASGASILRDALWKNKNTFHL